MAVIRGTTPTFRLTLQDDSVDLTEALNVYATFKQLSTVLTKTGEDLEVSATRIDVFLSQEETLRFTKGTVEVQVNWTYADGTRDATLPATFEIKDNLVGRVLE